jgi:hypothetical protein
MWEERHIASVFDTVYICFIVEGDLSRRQDVELALAKALGIAMA